MSLVTKFENEIYYYKMVRGPLNFSRLKSKINGYPVVYTISVSPQFLLYPFFLLYYYSVYVYYIAR